MSDAIDDLRAMGDIRKAMRKEFGVNCPQCAIKRPKAHPTILLHGQRCRVDGYRDPRPEPSNDEVNAKLAPYGISVRDGSAS
jgi:hypothetical protein